MIRYISYLSVLFILNVSCVKINPEPIENPNVITVGNNDLIISNEGGFQSGNASISIYNKDENTVNNNLYQSINQSNIGDILQSITHINHELFLIVNNSQKIIIIDDRTFEYKSEINGFISPRNLIPINSNTALVTDLYANKIFVIDLNNKSIISEIDVNGWCEEMILHNGKVYVANVEGNQLYVIDTYSNQITDSISVTENPSELEIDYLNNIWILSKGDITNNINPTLSILNSTNDSIIYINTLDSFNGSPSNLTMNSNRSYAFFIQSDVMKTKINYPLQLETIYYNTGQQFYGLGIDPYNKDIYLSDAIDYVQNGTIYRLDSTGNEKDVFSAGIIPNQFLFY
jgi:YVTN family beta-propeller protein